MNRNSPGFFEIEISDSDSWNVNGTDHLSQKSMAPTFARWQERMPGRIRRGYIKYSAPVNCSCHEIGFEIMNRFERGSGDLKYFKPERLWLSFHWRTLWDQVRHCKFEMKGMKRPVTLDGKNFEIKTRAWASRYRQRVQELKNSWLKIASSLFLPLRAPELHCLLAGTSPAAKIPDWPVAWPLQFRVTMDLPWTETIHLHYFQILDFTVHQLSVNSKVSF